jgi:hypothetical protein
MSSCEQARGEDKSQDGRSVPTWVLGATAVMAAYMIIFLA